MVILGITGLALTTATTVALAVADGIVLGGGSATCTMSWNNPNVTVTSLKDTDPAGSWSFDNGSGILETTIDIPPKVTATLSAKGGIRLSDNKNKDSWVQLANPTGNVPAGGAIFVVTTSKDPAPQAMYAFSYGMPASFVPNMSNPGKPTLTIDGIHIKPTEQLANLLNATFGNGTASMDKEFAVCQGKFGA